MPEFRMDPLSGRWTIIAEDRAGRPSDFGSQPLLRAAGRCPFCLGNEEDTPLTIAQYPAGSSTANWQVRVVPNKYPAATISSQPSLNAASDSGVGVGGGTGNLPTSSLFIGQPGVGIHEVLIESPRHVASFSQLSSEQVRLSGLAYRDRLSSIHQNPEISYGSIFKNCRGGGGATLEHVHSQLLATSILPYEIEQELRNASAHYEKRGECLYCALLGEELSSGARIVANTEQLVAYCPYASRFPYETWIVPRLHRCRFESSVPELLAEVVTLLQKLVIALEKLYPEVAYNYWIHTAPLRVTDERAFHWHVQLVSRITSQGGYEWGTGCFVNPVAPETAARRMRSGIEG